MLGKTLKLSIALFAILFWASAANALSLEEAGVEKGEAEVQYEATYTDDNGEGAYEHEHEIEAQLGVTNWLLLTVGIGFEEEEGERSFEFSEIEAAATIELVDPENGGFGFALYGRLSKEFAVENDEANESAFALGVIAEQHFDNWLVRGNLFYTSDIDAEDDEQFDGIEYAYQIRYNLNNNFGIGVEGYGTDVDFDDADGEDVTTHMVGPVLYISREIGERGEQFSSKDNDDNDDVDDDEDGMELEAQIGVLFGTNDDTADVTLKWGLEIDF